MTTEAFGLRKEDWGGIGQKFGWFSFFQIGLILVSLYYILFNKYYWRKTSFRRGLHLVILMSIVYLGISLLCSLTIMEVFKSFSKTRNLLLIPLVFHLLHLDNEGKALNKVLVLGGLISSGVAFLCIFGVYESDVITISVLPDFRMVLPTGLLMFYGFLICADKFFLQGFGLHVLFGLICLFGTLAQMHRSVLLATATVFVLIAMLKGRRLYKYIPLFGAVVYGFVFLLDSLGYSLVDLVEIYQKTLGEFESGSGNIGVRFSLIENSINLVIRNYGLGIGYVWEEIQSLRLYLTGTFYATPTLDNAYANVIIVFGIPGLLAIWALLSLICKSLLRLLIVRNNRTKFIEILMLVYLMIIASASYVFILGANSLIFLIVLLRIQNRFNEKDHIKA